MDVRPSMLRGYQPRRIVREGERERPGEVDSQTDQRIVDRWIHEVALFNDSFLAGFKPGGGKLHGPAQASFAQRRLLLPL